MVMKKGTFYGVGVGPGDPELLTLKAVRVIGKCPVIGAPRTRDGRMLALEIAKQAVDLNGKTLLPLDFSMERDKSRQRAAHEKAAGLVEKELEQGRDVAMLNLGDVSIYATFTYVREILEARGFETVMVPGVPSFCAVAAKLRESLTAGEEPLHILPALGPGLEEALALPGTKVLMKSGKQLGRVSRSLHGGGHQAALVCDCGLPTERVYRDLAEAPEGLGYFATVVVKSK